MLGELGLEGLARSRSRAVNLRAALGHFLAANGWSSAEEGLRCASMDPEGAVLVFLRYARSRGLANKSILTYLTCLRGWLLANGVSVELARLRPFIPHKSPVREFRPLRREDVRRIVLNARPSRRLLFWTLASCGLRISEALALRVMDIDLEARPPRLRVRRSKTRSGRARIVFIPRDLAAALREKLEDMDDEAPAFPSEGNPHRPPHKDRVLQSLRATLRQMGILRRDPSGRGFDVTPHSLRRYYETSLAASGVHPFAIAKLLGHDIGVEAHYYQPTTEMIAEEWRKAEPALTLLAQDQSQEARVRELEERLKIMEETISLMTRILKIENNINNKASTTR